MSDHLSDQDVRKLLALAMLDAQIEATAAGDPKAAAAELKALARLGMPGQPTPEAFAEWDESKHPRADDGKFGHGGKSSARPSGGAATRRFSPETQTDDPWKLANPADPSSYADPTDPQRSRERVELGLSAFPTALGEKPYGSHGRITPEERQAAPWADVPLEDFLAVQDNIQPGKVAYYLSGGKRKRGASPPFAIRLENGDVHLIDGHHQATAALLAGKKSFRVKLYEHGGGGLGPAKHSEGWDESKHPRADDGRFGHASSPSKAEPWRPAPTLTHARERARLAGVESLSCDGCGSDESSLAKANVVMSALAALHERAPGLARLTEGRPLRGVTYHARRYVDGRPGLLGAYRDGVLHVATNHPESHPAPTYGASGVDDSVSGLVRHEYMHHVWDGLSEGQREAWAKVWDKDTFAEKVSRYGATDAEEGFAEAASAYLHPAYGKGGHLPDDVHEHLAALLGGKRDA